MNAKERRQLARLETKIRLLEEQREEYMDVYREMLADFVRVKMENEAWRELAGEIVKGEW
jgi:hypothetical protein